MTYHRLFEDKDFSPEELIKLRQDNYVLLEPDERLRCQHCQGFYWRLWYDQAQCLGCQNYSMVEVENAGPVVVGIGTFTNWNNLLQVGWIREELTTKDGIDITRRITDPLSDRSEFIVFTDRLRCRVTGMETLISPKITGYWLLKVAPKVDSKILTEQEALNLVKQSKRDIS